MDCDSKGIVLSVPKAVDAIPTVIRNGETKVPIENDLTNELLHLQLLEMRLTNLYWETTTGYGFTTADVKDI